MGCAAHWYPDWTGRPCLIVAAGESASRLDLAKARGRAFVLAVNRSFELVPWADALYACDFRFWNQYPSAATFAGLKITQDVRVVERWPDVRRVRLVDAPVSFAPGAVASGGNGGFQALSLAAQFGANPVMLAGYDMRGAHWHGVHPKPLNNPREDNFADWIERYQEAAPLLAAAGVRVINLNTESALTCFPFMSLVETLRCGG